MYPDDPQRPPRTRRYQQGDYDYPQQAYSRQQPQPYQPDDYEQQYQQPQQHPAPRKPIKPTVNPGVFAGGVIATAVVTGLAGWLVAWIIRTIFDRINEAGKYGLWNPMAGDQYWFAVVGFVCALVGGALWYVLQLSTPAPDQFYGWIVGLLIVAAVVLPLLLSTEWEAGLATAIVHLAIGLPILYLIRGMGSRSLGYR